MTETLPAHTRRQPESPGRHHHSLRNVSYTVFAVHPESLHALFCSSIQSIQPLDTYLLSEMPCGRCCEGEMNFHPWWIVSCAVRALPWQCRRGSSERHGAGLEGGLEVRAGDRRLSRQWFSDTSGGQRAQSDDRVLLGPGASTWKCPHSCYVAHTTTKLP